MIVFHEDIKKGLNAPDIALMKLRAYLDTNEPQLVYFLQNFWDKQQRAITYKELREAILSGVLDEEMISEWQKDYSRFVVDYVEPLWIAAMLEATKELEERRPGFYFDPMSKGIQMWNEKNAARFVTNVCGDQIAAIRAVVKRASETGYMNVDSLSRAIRPMVGLNRPQAIANLNYYQAMIDSGVKESKAIERCIRYSARQNRQRGYLIARTELAFSYNQGSLEGVKQAQAAGLMGPVKKRWCTADDERVCPICGGLEGTEIEMDDIFTYREKGRKNPVKINPRLKTKQTGLTPPAHPNCRCGFLVIEQGPPDMPDNIEPSVRLPEGMQIAIDGQKITI